LMNAANIDLSRLSRHSLGRQAFTISIHPRHLARAAFSFDDSDALVAS